MSPWLLVMGETFRKGDIITAPSDIITRGVSRGVLHLEA